MYSLRVCSVEGPLIFGMFLWWSRLPHQTREIALHKRIVSNVRPATCSTEVMIDPLFPTLLQWGDYILLCVVPSELAVVRENESADAVIFGHLEIPEVTPV